MKKYKLKKEFPGSKIGDVWVKADNGFMSPEGREFIKMHEHLFKPFTDWFEDYKEPKEYWYICTTRNYEITRVIIDEGTDFDRVQKDKEIGNYFETMEECEKVIEKLKSWKRLKDSGFRFIDHTDCNFDGNITIWGKFDKELNEEDINLLFGGEE